MESLLFDLRHALRVMRQRPLFAIVACFSIALGIGATTAVISVIGAMLVRPPAGVGAPDRAIEIGRTMGGRGRDTFSYPEFRDMRLAGASVLEHVAAWDGEAFSYASEDGGERHGGMLVSASYFDVMAVRPALGRFFRPEEDATPLTHPVVVISEAFWRTRLASDPGVIGRDIVLNRHRFTVIGVAPAPFHGHIIGFRPSFWVPMMMLGAVRPGADRFESRGSSWLMIVARLRPGATARQAEAAVQTVFTAQPQPADRRETRSAAVDALGAVPAAARGPVRVFLGILLALTGMVLLVTCTNVAGMLLARAASREREIGVRLALGSTRGRLIRQLTAESMLLFTAGGLAGLGLAWAVTRLVSGLAIPAPVPIVLDLSPDWRVLVVGLSVALLTGVLFGLAPALQASRPDVTGMLRGSTAVQRGRLRRAFVVTQVAVTMALLLSAGLFLRAMARASQVDTGFTAGGVHVARVELARDGYDEQRGRAFIGGLMASLEATPGIEAAAVAEDLPLDLGRSEQFVYTTSPMANEDGVVITEFNVVSAGYFDALRIQLLRGRAFSAGDGSDAAPVAIVSRTFAERVWPGRDPLGEFIRLDSATAEPARVIGVVGDVKNGTLTEPARPMLYLPVTQRWLPGLNILARSAGGDGAATLRRMLRQADPMLAVGEAGSLESLTSFGLLPQRMAAWITSSLGSLALLLSMLGVYGVIAYMVTQRTREIGIRMAIGARTSDVLRLIVSGSLRLALPGLALGLLAGLGLSFVLRAFVLGVPPGDPVTFGGVTLLLLLAIVVACWVPARRAVAIHPTEALKSE